LSAINTKHNVYHQKPHAKDYEKEPGEIIDISTDSDSSDDEDHDDDDGTISEPKTRDEREPPRPLVANDFTAQRTDDDTGDGTVTHSNTRDEEESPLGIFVNKDKDKVTRGVPAVVDGIVNQPNTIDKKEHLGIVMNKEIASCDGGSGGTLAEIPDVSVEGKDKVSCDSDSDEEDDSDMESEELIEPRFTRSKNTPDYFINEDSKKKGDHREPPWEEQYEKLKVFQSMHHHCSPSLSNDPDKSLDDWANRQRRWRSLNTLDDSKAKKLEDIGFDWHTHADQFEKAWCKQYTAVANLAQKTGDFVPKDKKLYRWITKQRRFYREGSLLQGRKERLLKINFPFVGKSQRQAKDNDDDLELGQVVKTTCNIETWDKHYQTLVAFQVKHHHCVPELVKNQNPSFREWVIEQRRLKQGMSAQRKKKLDDIGFFFNPRAPLYEEQWIGTFATLSSLIESNGDFSRFDPVLQKWIGRQREHFKDGTLMLGRRQRLEQIKFPFVLPSTEKRAATSAAPSPHPKKKLRVGDHEEDDKKVSEDKKAALLPHQKKKLCVGAHHYDEKQDLELKKGASLPDPLETLGPLVIKLRGLQVKDSCLVDCCNVIQRLSMDHGGHSVAPDKKAVEEDPFAYLLSLTTSLRGTVTEPQKIHDCATFLSMMVDEAQNSK